MKKYFTLIALLISICAVAGGWPKKKGSGYYKLGYSMINGMHFFNSNGGKEQLGRNLKYSTLSLYGEYGITNKTTVVGYFPVVTTAKLEAQSGVSEASLTTVGDINIGIRYGLIVDKPNVLSLSATLGLPTGKTSSDTSSGSESLQTGDGEFNQLIKFESGHSLGNGFYASSFLGVNIRSKGFSEEIHFGGEVGHVGSNLISILKFQSINSFNNGDNTAVANADFFNNNMEIFALSPEFAYKISKKIGVSINHTIYLSGKKTLASPNTTIGIFWDL